MPDSNLTTSIAAIKTKITTDAPTATVDTLLSLARAAKSVGLTEDASVENAINSRALTLSSGATTADMVKLSNTIKQVRNETSSSGLSDISQLTDSTNIVPTTLANLTDVHTTTPTDGQTLVWDNANSRYVPSTPAATGATTGYVDTAIANLVDSSPTTLNTLNEIAAAIGDDPNFGTSLTTSITSKLNIADFNNKADQWASGALSLSTLSDVGTNPPTNNQILSYDAQSGYWYGADLIDAEASGAVMKVSVTTSGIGFVVDEDDLVSNSDTKVPTQQSVKAYVDSLQSSTSNFAALAGNLDDIADGVTYKKSENNFTPGLKNKLDNINTSLYVTYSTLAADITTAGAQMTSTLAADITTAGAIMKSASNGSATIPNGTTSQRDSSPNAGFFRWNTTTSSAEIYDGNVWGLVGGGNTTSEIMWEHFRDVSSNYQIETGNNAVAAGTITIESGGSVEIPTGSTWAIV